MQKLHSTTEQTVPLIPLKEGYIIVPGLSSNGSSGISSHARARNSRRRSNNKDYLGGFRPLLQRFKLFYKIWQKNGNPFVCSYYRQSWVPLAHT